MPNVLIATDADWIHDDVDAALADKDTTVMRVRSGREVFPAVAEHEPDLVVLDLQIGNMGGIATFLHLKQEAEDGRMPEMPVLMLLDRPADVPMTRRVIGTSAGRSSSIRTGTAGSRPSSASCWR